MMLRTKHHSSKESTIQEYTPRIYPRKPRLRSHDHDSKYLCSTSTTNSPAEERGFRIFCGKGATDDQCIHMNLPGRSGKIRFLLVASTCNWYQAEVPSRTFLVHYRHVKDHWSTALELALSGTIQLPVRCQQSCALLRNRNSRTHRSNDFRKRSRHINMYQLQSWLVQGNLIDEMQSSILKWLIHCDNDQCETSVHRLNTHSVQAQQCMTSGPVGRSHDKKVAAWPWPAEA